MDNLGLTCISHEHLLFPIKLLKSGFVANVKCWEDPLFHSLICYYTGVKMCGFPYSHGITFTD